MNHYLLPQAPRGTENSARYGDTAYETLLIEMLRAGANKQSLFAGVYGGSSIIRDGCSANISIGKTNWQLVVERLSSDRIPISKIDLGGTVARKVSFCAADGSVVVHKADISDHKDCRLCKSSPSKSPIIIASKRNGH